MSAKTYALLAAAIVAEVIATTALTASESFTKLWPSIGTVIGYAIAFWFLSFPLRVMPAGLVYAIWSAFGIMLMSGVAWIWFKQSLDVPALLGLGLIIVGVAIIHLFSKSLAH